MLWLLLPPGFVIPLNERGEAFTWDGCRDKRIHVLVEQRPPDWDVEASGRTLVLESDTGDLAPYKPGRE